MKKLLMTALIITTLSAQGLSINVSGRTEDINGSAVSNAEIIVEQYTNPNWQLRGSTNSNQLGEFTIALNNITSVENSQTESPIQFISLESRYLESPVKTIAEIKIFNLLGEEVPQQITEIEITAGRNLLPDPKMNNLVSGIYLRRIRLDNGNSLTQKIANINGGISYGKEEKRITYKNNHHSSLKKRTSLSSDSLYIRTIAMISGYYSDTIITAVSKSNLADITGLEHKLKPQETYNIPIHIRNFLHENETDITIHIKNPLTGQKQTYEADQNGKIIINPPKDFGPNVEIWYTPTEEPDSNFINFQAIQDSLMFGKKNLYNAKLTNNQIQNYIEANLDTLQNKIDNNNPLVYKILRRYSESNQQPGFNGTYDLTNTDHLGFLLNAQGGIIRKFNANITDTLHVFISDYVHHNSQATNEIASENDRNWRDEWLQDYEQLWNNTNDNWKYMHLKIHKVNDLYNNEILNEHRAKYGNKNFILVNINDQSGPSNIMKFEHITNEFMNGIIDFLDGGTTFFNYNEELAGPFIIQEEQNSIFAFNPAAVSSNAPPGDATPYKGTKFNETGAKLLNFNANIDQNYKYPWQIYEPRND